MAMSWSSSGPTIEHILAANKAVNELKQTADVVLRVPPIPPDEAIWVSVADASMANVENRSQGGFVLALAHESLLQGFQADFSIISWKSHKLKRVIKATLVSEALAMSSLRKWSGSDCIVDDVHTPMSWTALVLETRRAPW